MRKEAGARWLHVLYAMNAMSVKSAHHPGDSARPRRPWHEAEIPGAALSVIAARRQGSGGLDDPGGADLDQGLRPIRLLRADSRLHGAISGWMQTWCGYDGQDADELDFRHRPGRRMTPALRSGRKVLPILEVQPAPWRPVFVTARRQVEAHGRVRRSISSPTRVARSEAIYAKASPHPTCPLQQRSNAARPGPRRSAVTSATGSTVPCSSCGVSATPTPLPVPLGRGGGSCGTGRGHPVCCRLQTTPITAGISSPGPRPWQLWKYNQAGQIR